MWIDVVTGPLRFGQGNGKWCCGVSPALKRMSTMHGRAEQVSVYLGTAQCSL